ncbi:hypothetical protein [Streptomyces arenae]|uniref:hypothetical protein n=1 Tax=Streptomyces arenae TaxID=29301 RepID=UPI00265AAAD8|nr:hypothetical protein [Streptomyces arenae]MCG7203971.1 hypothetical protein [Streptomyces arenae]
MDWKWTVTAILPVASLVLGAWLNQLSESRRETAALVREAKVRELDREQARIERRESFELTHLVEVTNLLLELYDASYRCNSRAIDGHPLGEARTELQRCNRQMTRLKGFVLDETVRGLVDAAHSQANRLSEDTAGDWRVQAGIVDQLEAAQEALAQRIRAIYSTQADRS